MTVIKSKNVAKIFKVVVILFSATLSQWVLAEDDELRFGVIDSYTIGEPKILISDLTRVIAPNMKVYNSSGALVGRTHLKEGQPVNYKSYRRESDRRDVIQEIHILPQDN